MTIDDAIFNLETFGRHHLEKIQIDHDKSCEKLLRESVAVLESAGGQVLIYPELTPLEYNQKENILNPYFIAASPKWFERT
jgi:hypothetical protein